MLPFTLQQLRILKAVATEKNFTKAAEILYLSQPSLSKQIKKLEKNLDILLINRDTNKIFLTKKGKVLLQYSEKILTLCEESCRTLNDLKSKDRGHFMVGLSQTLKISLMPRLIGIFTKNYPQMNLKVEVNSTEITLQNILNKEIDIAIIEDKISNDLQKNFKIDHFVYDEIGLIISKSYSISLKKRITKEDLYYLDFITLTSNYSIKRVIEKILFQNKIEIKQLKTILQLDSIEGVKAAVSLGLGVAFMPLSYIEKDIQMKTLEIVTIENLQIIQKLYIVTSQDSYKSKILKFFSNELIRLKTRIKN